MISNTCYPSLTCAFARIVMSLILESLGWGHIWHKNWIDLPLCVKYFCSHQLVNFFSHPTPRIGLFVGLSVTNLPHHRYMHQGQGSWIFALWIHALHQGRGSRIIIRVKDHGYICIAHTHSSYMHTPGSRIKDICIIHTCIKIKGYWYVHNVYTHHAYVHHAYMHHVLCVMDASWKHASWMHASWIHTSWILASWIQSFWKHASWIYDAYTHEASMYDACMHDACIHIGCTYGSCTHGACTHDAYIYDIYDACNHVCTVYAYMMHISMIHVWCMPTCNMYIWCEHLWSTHQV